MKKLSKICIIFILLTVFSISVSTAANSLRLTSPDGGSTNSIDSVIDNNNEILDNIIDSSNSTDFSTDYSYNTQQEYMPTSYEPYEEQTMLDNLPENELGLTNILYILLITIGVVLILFAIAIIIRLKK